MQGCVKSEMWLTVDGCVGRLFDEINNWCLETKKIFLYQSYKIQDERWENDKLKQIFDLDIKRKDKSSLKVQSSNDICN